MSYVVTDERDVVRLRTNYLNRLREQPEWCNALTHDCTTSIQGLAHRFERRSNDRARAAGDDPRFSVRIREGLPRMNLVSGPGGATR
jgi:hypothetical protein